MIDFIPLLLALVMLLSVVVTSFLVPLIRSKTTAQQRETANSLVKIAVSAMEQVYRNDPHKGVEKKKAVEEFLRSHGVKIDSAEIDKMIESAVYQLTTYGLFIDASDTAMSDEREVVSDV